MKNFEQISLDLLKRLTEEVMKFRFASKFHIVYKTLIALFLNRASLDETLFVVMATKEICKTRDEFMASTTWEDSGTDVMRFNSEMRRLFHEFVKLGCSFSVAPGYVQDTAQVDEIWLELRKVHDSLLSKELIKEKA